MSLRQFCAIYFSIAAVIAYQTQKPILAAIFAFLGSIYGVVEIFQQARWEWHQ